MSAVGSILTNQGALDALQSISTTSAENNTLENEMSTGLAISSPASNPAGYITAQGFTSQLNGITQAISNANQGVSLLQTATGALQQQIGVAQQLNSIAVQAANGTETSQEATSLQSVVTQLTGQVTNIATQTQFNNVSLLNGSFNNVQFQVGANEGQTMSLSIGNTSASALGMYQTGATASTVSAAAGGYGTTKFSVSVGGNNLGSVTPLAANESAAGIASQINSVAGAGGVTATASNSVALKAGALSSSKQLTLSLTASGSGKAIGSTIQATGSSLTSLATNINKGTTQTGISASVNSAGSLIVTQSQGQNIKFAAAGSGSLTYTSGSTTGSIGTGTSSTGTIQGSVQLAAASEVTTNLTAANDGISSTGTTANNTFYSLASVNVSSVNGTSASATGAALNAQGGANQAINVVKYALDSLNNTGGQLGAVQQGLTANINNLNTTSQNVTSALGVVQDANLPQVANQLTQAQIQAQAGVAALKSSTTMQQSYLSLLP